MQLALKEYNYNPFDEIVDKQKRIQTERERLEAEEQAKLKAEMKLSIDVKNAKIYYTINGFTPNAVDHEYTGLMVLKIPAGEERIVKSVVITSSGKRSVVTTTVLNGL